MSRLKIVSQTANNGMYSYGIPKLVDADTGEDLDIGGIQEVTVEFRALDYTIINIKVAGEIAVEATEQDHAKS